MNIEWNYEINGKRRLKKKVKALKYEIKNGNLTSKEAKKYLSGHLGYIKYANTKNLEDKLFYKIWRTWGQIKKVNSSNLVNRGGNYNNTGSNNPASNRNNNNATNYNNNIGFRPALIFF